MKLLYTLILIFALLRVGGDNNLESITHKHNITMQQEQPQPAGQYLGKLLLLVLCVGFMMVPSFERDEPPANTHQSKRGYSKSDTTTNTTKTATISEGKDISAK